ncbi:MAG: signal peptidase II [Gammaproteobacteria bacterium]
MRNMRWLWLSLLVIVCDQVTKIFIVSHFTLNESVRLFPVLNFTLEYNRGAAFSFLSEASGWQNLFFIVVSLVAIVVMLVWLCRSSRHAVFLHAGLASIVGGAVGNLIDRVRLGYVIDFIEAHIGNAYWPVFNVADSMITIGVVLLIFSMALSKS